MESLLLQISNDVPNFDPYSCEKGSDGDDMTLLYHDILMISKHI